jgi:hypothetical protein
VVNACFKSKSKSKSKSHYDRQSVGQFVLVSGTHLGPATNFAFSLRVSCRQLRLISCSALSGESTGLLVVVCVFITVLGCGGRWVGEDTMGLVVVVEGVVGMVFFG